MVDPLETIPLEDFLVITPDPEPKTSPRALPVPGRGYRPPSRPLVSDAEDLFDATGLELQQRLMVEAYAKTGTVSAACKLVGVAPQTHKKWLEESPEYQELFQQAFEAITDALESVSLTAALDPENSRERQFQLRARRPDRYNPATTVKGEVKHSHTLVDLVKQAHKDGALEAPR